MELTKTNPLKEVLEFGQSIWYDGLVSEEEFERLIREDGIRGATTNPTIFEKALGHHDYDDEIRRLAKTHSSEEIYKSLSVRAVQRVADCFLPVFKDTSAGDGYVSIEVNPLLARDTQKTIREAQELWRLVNRSNVMVKVPATREGIPAVEALIAQGINVNITLIFSVERYRQVMEAYLSGLKQRVERNQELSQCASVASFFVSRVDTLVDKRLEEKKAPASLLGRAGIANSKVAYEAFEQAVSSPSFWRLKQKNARVQRPLWASTGTKNPAYSDVLYVEALIGPDTVDTIPPATLDAFRDHGSAAPRLEENLAEAHAVLDEIERFGISMREVTEKLEMDGVKLFADSHNKIIEAIRLKSA